LPLLQNIVIDAAAAIARDETEPPIPLYQWMIPEILFRLLAPGEGQADLQLPEEEVGALAATDPERHPVPAKVVRQPVPQAEAALAGGAVVPDRGHLVDAHAEALRLDGQFQRQLEAGRGLDRDGVEQPAAVHAEVTGRVVDRQASHHVER